MSRFGKRLRVLWLRRQLDRDLDDELRFHLEMKANELGDREAAQIASANLSDPKRLPERYWTAQMSANGFVVSEQKALLGRVFEKRDELPGAAPVTVLTYHVWQDRFGNDAGILGQTIRVNNVPTTIVGVMPPGKRFPEDVDLWTALVPDEQLERRENRSVALFGRMREGVTLAFVRNEMSTIAGRLAIEYPATNKNLTADVEPIAQITGAYALRPLFVALWVSVGFVLLIACADVANMLLARGAGRMREIAVRVAIGAARSRIVRQLLIESVSLSLAGGFLGWFVALGGLRWFDAGTGNIPKPVWLNLTLDRTAFGYLAAVSIGAGILFGLAPALRLARTDVHTPMKDGGQGVAGGRRVLSLANLLVVLETALCIVLLAGAGLMIRSTVNLYAAPIGVDTANVLTMRLSLAEAKYPSGAELAAFHRSLSGAWIRWRVWIHPVLPPTCLSAAGFPTPGSSMASLLKRTAPRRLAQLWPAPVISV